MKSSIDNYIAYQEIPVPEEILTIEIPSWDAVAQPVLDRALVEYRLNHDAKATELTDGMVEQLNLPGIASVSQLKQLGMTTYEKRQKEAHYYYKLLPYILNYYYINSNILMNSQERAAYVEEYMQQVQGYAEEAGMTVRAYGRQVMGITEDNVREVFEQRALEDFTFKLLAQDIADRQGLVLDEESYERFIQRNVLENGADEIALREELPLKRYQEIYPEMALSQEWYDYFYPQIRFKINPEVTLPM